MTLLAAVVALFWLRALLVTWRDLRRAPRLSGTPSTPPTTPPRVSVIIPARNEAANIERCVRSVLAQSWPHLEVIAVDDRSEDATGDILARLATEDQRLRVIQGSPLPPGWMGKNHACAQGAALATGDRLLFTDADSDHGPHCLALALAEADRLTADLLTLLPHQVCVSTGEKFLQPAFWGLLLSLESFASINAGATRSPAANGQFLLFKRSTYDAVGGHAGVKDRVVDDLALGRAVLDGGLKLRVAIGTEVLRVRMYTSLGEVWWGYVKNFFAGPALVTRAERSTLRFVLALALAILLCAWVVALGLVPVVGLFLPPPTAALCGLALALALATRVIQNRKFFALSPFWALTLPLGHLFVAGMGLHSTFRALTGAGPRWKGRTYAGVR